VPYVRTLSSMACVCNRGAPPTLLADVSYQVFF